MEIGVVVPQGWVGEYDGWDASTAWQRSIAIALEAESLGFGSLWVFDHFHTVPEPTNEITFESFAVLTWLAAITTRVRLGHLVLCAGFRNPAVVAKSLSTLDVMSGGRIEIGIGAGWKRDEWVAYGFAYPDTKERLAALRDQLEVITRMVEPGADVHATYRGEHASVVDAVNVPKPLQRPRLPIMVGGNGPKVTWPLAARFADELNLDGMSPAEVATALPSIAAACEGVGRDPATLKVSVHVWGNVAGVAGAPRVELLQAYQELGVARVMMLLKDAVTDDSTLASLALDCRTAGVHMQSDETGGARPA